MSGLLKHEELETAESRLWDLYVESNSNDIKEKLASKYAYLVKQIAGKLYKRRSDEIADYEDYLHYGFVGLLEAIDRYNPHQDTSFKTFANYRIFGAILNGIEKVSEARTQYAQRSRLIKERVQSISYNDNEKDLFSELVNTAIHLALGYLLDEAANAENKEEHYLDGKAYNSDEIAQMQIQLKHIVEKLPCDEKVIIQYHYFHYVSFEELGDILGVTKGRVSQLHKSAIVRIREIFESEASLDKLY